MSLAMILELLFGFFRRRPRQIYLGCESNAEIDRRLRRAR